MYALIVLAMLSADDSSAYFWQPWTEDPSVMCLFVRRLNERGELFSDCIGQVINGEYCPWDAKRGYVYVPDSKVPKEAPPIPFGVSLENVSKQTRYRHTGVEVSRGEALQLIESKIPDRSGQWWITVVGGTDDQRQSVLRQIPEDVLRECRVNSYGSDHWATKCGFDAGKPVAMYVQDSTGKVWHRQDDAKITPELINQLRDRNKNWSPDKAPDRRVPILPLLGIPSLPPTLAIAGLFAAGVAIYSLLNKRQS